MKQEEEEYTRGHVLNLLVGFCLCSPFLLGYYLTVFEATVEYLKQIEIPTKAGSTY